MSEQSDLGGQQGKTGSGQTSRVHRGGSGGREKRQRARGEGNTNSNEAAIFMNSAPGIFHTPSQSHISKVLKSNY